MKYVTYKPHNVIYQVSGSSTVMEFMYANMAVQYSTVQWGYSLTQAYCTVLSFTAKSKDSLCCPVHLIKKLLFK